jgi:tetratricopeptide (TPR) repeat protein
MIPNLWFRFAKGENNVDDMAAVLYHNQEDIVSMAPLAHALLATFAGVIDPHPRDVLSLAKAYARLGSDARAEAAFRQALGGPLSAEQRFEAMSRLAALLKRQGRRDQAALWWQAQIELAPTASVAPYIELAKYHEWETGDLAAARLWTEKAIAAAQTWRAGYHRSQTLAELEHRWGRLQRKG